MEYKILNKEDFKNWIVQYCQLYSENFTAPISEDYVRWRYLENPLSEVLICVGIDKGKLIANTAASPCILINKGEIQKTAVSLNLMVDKNYRGRNVFTDIVTKLYSYMKEKNYKSVLGFPNYLSNPTFTEKIGRKTIYEIPTLELSLKNFKSELPVYSTVFEDDSFSYKYLNYILPDKKIYIKKDKQYLKWRYYKNPYTDYKNFVILNKNYEVQSFLICKEYKNILNIVDFNFKDNLERKTLISHVIKFAIELNKDSVTIWSQIGTLEHLFLQRMGFRNNSPITYFSGKILDDTIDGHDFYDYRNWFINMGDDNVY
ncbi:GNAT family N-acetyltransferase [Oceanobacillus oncorhynchi]|uniref:GNAT family N-acetyltransferase n=1 Tax=Oceanobacillus oncorhynchi TaxID=545501 RepID=UPI0034D4CF34